MCYLVEMGDIIARGGRVYGFMTVLNLSGHRATPTLTIDETEAEVVRRIFEAYADGATLHDISAMLNAEGVSAPYDGRSTKKLGAGWRDQTVRSMLLNPAYVGRFIRNRTTWERGPDGRRRPVARPVSEWLVEEAADLRIVEAGVWERVQARFAARRRVSWADDAIVIEGGLEQAS